MTPCFCAILHVYTYVCVLRQYCLLCRYVCIIGGEIIIDYLVATSLRRLSYVHHVLNLLTFVCYHGAAYGVNMFWYGVGAQMGQCDIH